jgi:hypothetical protein
MADLGPALALAENTGRLVRPAVGAGAARPGELATSGALAHDAELYAAAELPDRARIAALIDAVIKVGGGQSEDDLQDRLVAAGVVYNPEDLDVALERLTDSGRLMRPKPRPTVENPNPPRSLVMASLPGSFSQSSDQFSDIDSLAADVHACIKRRGDAFGSDPILSAWLAEDGIRYEPEQLRDALNSSKCPLGSAVRTGPGIGHQTLFRAT